MSRPRSRTRSRVCALLTADIIRSRTRTSITTTPSRFLTLPPLEKYWLLGCNCFSMYITNLLRQFWLTEEGREAAEARTQGATLGRVRFGNGLRFEDVRRDAGRRQPTSPAGQVVGLGRVQGVLVHFAVAALQAPVLHLIALLALVHQVNATH